MYVRKDKDCKTASKQPAHVAVKDVYGNTFENWCVDFVGTDKDCAPNGKTGCAPQDPDGLLTKYKSHKSDNTERTLLLYIKSPLIPGTTIREAVLIEGVAILGLEEDRDLILYNANNTQALQLEDDTEVLPTATFT